MSKWLSIKDYSNRTKISVSTLRRKIKENNIKYKTEQGKYLIFFEEDEEDKKDLAQIKTVKPNKNNQQEDFIKFVEQTISSINKLNQDLIEEKEKRLSVQDELIKQLKEEVIELRMLVKVLESSAKS
jgi:uncharacterized protein YegL